MAEPLLAPKSFLAPFPLATRSTQPVPALRRLTQDLCWGAGVLLVAALSWCVLTGHTTAASWRVPPAYGGDALEVLAHLRAAAEWNVVPLLPNHVARLGAPFGAEWSEYPAADDLLLLGAGQLSRVIGLALTANLLTMAAFASAAVAFFCTARWLGHRREWAAAAGLAFAFCYHSSSRGFAHYSLLLTYPVPLALLSAWLVARSARLGWRTPGAAVLAFTAVALGVGNPYNLLLFLQLLGWAIVAAHLDHRPRLNLHLGLATLALAIVVFGVVNADVWYAASPEHAAPLMARNYGGVERYALKPIELLLPPADHRVGALAFWGHRYLRWSEWRGEAFSPYLGVFGAAGLVGLLLTSALALLAQHARRAHLGLQAGWILLFSAVGGLNSLLALFLGVQIFRATNRYSVFLLALALIFLTGLATRASRRWPRWVSLGAAVLCAALALWEETPGRAAPDVAGAAERFRADVTFGAALEQALPRGAAVFQLPAVEFPEARPAARLEDYELFRPYLHTTSLRFSYGALKQRCRSEWSRECARLPVPELIATLERAGFAALYIHRRGFSDQATSLLATLAAAGRPVLLTSASGQQVVVRLHPAAVPQPPLAARLTFGAGWNRRNSPDDPARWAYGDASLAYFNPLPHAVTAQLSLAFLSDDARHVDLRWNGEALPRLSLVPGLQRPDLPRVVLHPGVNRLDLTPVEPARRRSDGPAQLRAFGVRDAAIALARN